MSRKWRKEDDTYFKRYARKRTLDELVARFRTEPDQVKAHLEELKLQTKDGHGYQEPWVDPALADFEKGLAAFHTNKIATASKHFQVVLDSSDESDLRNRAQVYLDVCEARESVDDEKSDDPFLEAVVAKNLGDFEAAMAVCNAGGRRSKDERFAYLAATVKAAAGEEEEALALLRQAIEMNPENRVHAFHDSDFDSMRSSADFEELFEGVVIQREPLTSAIGS
jgi:tetratricopeptide (TPR) repeat protein